MINIARIPHLPQIDTIYNQAVRDGLRTAHRQPLSREERLAWFEKHDPATHPIFVYLNGGNVLGWLSVSPYREGRESLNEVADISYYVDYNHHNKGIATRLMDRALTFCSDAPFRLLVAMLVSGNAESIAVLKKFGFAEWGRIPDAIHQGDTFRDHLYYGRKLTGD
jgi:phosphinothricin acetyltransferase